MGSHVCDNLPYWNIPIELCPNLAMQFYKIPPKRFWALGKIAVLLGILWALLPPTTNRWGRFANTDDRSMFARSTNQSINDFGDGMFRHLHEISPEHQLIVTSATCGYLDMLLNWIAQLRSLKLNNFLVIAEDLQAYEYLLTIIPRQTLMSSAFGRPFGEAPKKAATFGSSDYSWCSRPYYLRKLIEQNMTVIWIDSDAMLLKDPFVVVPHSEDDIIVSDDEPILAPIRSLTMPHYYCSCFIKVRPTAGAIAVLSTWARQCGSLSQDQPALNNALDIMAGTLKWQVLPRRVFPCGYDAERLTFAGAPGWESPAWVHANWRVGEESKEIFLKRVGIWHNMRAPVHCGVR